VDVVNEIAGERQVPAAQVSLAWVLSRPGVVSLVIGGRKIEHIRENIGATSLELSDDELARLNKVSDPPLIYPYWHQARFATSTFTDGDRALFGGRSPD